MRNILFVAFIVLSAPLMAQHGLVEGTVGSNGSREKLSGATVLLQGTHLVATSDDEGRFFLKNAPAGNYILVVEMTGYEVYKKPLHLTENERAVRDIWLSEKITDLETVQVFGKLDGEKERSARLAEKGANNLLNVVSAANMQHSPDINAANVLQRMPGVLLQRNSGASEAYAIVRGLEPRYNNTLINGVKIASPDEKGRFVPLDIVPSDLLQKIEISKSLIPEMEADAIGGTVNLVMKDAPENRIVNATLGIGYSTLFFDSKFTAFSTKNILEKSLYDRFGAGYTAKPDDFSRSNLNFKARTALPTGVAGLAWGKRFLNRRLGAMVAANFQNQYFGTRSIYNQVVPDINLNVPAISDVAVRYLSTQKLNSGLTARFDYAINEKNHIGITNVFLYSYLAQAREIIDTAIKGGNGGRTVPGTGPVTSDFLSITERQFIENVKLDGKHILSKNFLLDWGGAFSAAYKRTPDRADLSINTKIDTVHTDNTGGYKFIQTPYYFDEISRIWQHNADRDYDALANITYRAAGHTLPLEVKVGGMYRHKTRFNTQNEYILKPTTNANGVKQEFDNINTAQWVVYDTKGTQAYDINNYKLFENISAGYVQIKTVSKLFDVVGGVRVEKTHQGFTLNTFYPSGINGLAKDYADILPSAMIKLLLTKKAALRLSYFTSISRPNYYELVPATLLSNTSPTAETGNPELKHSVANNYDLRYELFPQKEEQFFVGAFYNKIKDPIEYTYQSVEVYAPRNLGTAELYGAEAVYARYFGNIGVSGNYTYIWSQIKSPKFYTDAVAHVTDPQKLQARPMQGQTNHTLNFSLIYRNEKRNIFSQLAYQFLGKTLARVYPIYGYDYYQTPQSILSLSAEKNLKKHFTVFGKFNNLLNTATRDKINNLPVVKDVYKTVILIGLRFSK